MKILKIEIERCGECVHCGPFLARAQCMHPDAIERNRVEGIDLTTIARGTPPPSWCPLPDAENLDAEKLVRSLPALEKTLAELEQAKKVRPETLGEVFTV